MNQERAQSFGGGSIESAHPPLGSELGQAIRAEIFGFEPLHQQGESLVAAQVVFSSHDEFSSVLRAIWRTAAYCWSLARLWPVRFSRSTNPAPVPF